MLRKPSAPYISHNGILSRPPSNSTTVGSGGKVEGDIFRYRGDHLGLEDLINAIDGSGV